VFTTHQKKRSQEISFHMIKPFLAIAATLAVSLASPAIAANIEHVVQQSRAAAIDQDYATALEMLRTAQKEHPDNVRLIMTEAQVLSWQGNHAEAEQRLSSLDAKHDTNADVMLLRANLAYIRQDYAKAEELYTAILAAHPDYVDAQNGLERVQKARAYAATQDYQWQLDMGYEHSALSRSAQPDWNQQFLQLNRFFNDQKTIVHGRTARYNQFRNIDSEYELGITQRFHDGLIGYTAFTFSPDADFRPDYRISAGGRVRVVEDSQDTFPVWLTLDARHDTYESTRILNVNPGLRIEPKEGWALSGKIIAVDEEGVSPIYGYDIRTDNRIAEKWGIYAGYADAPESVAGVVVDTTTYYGGVAVDVTPFTTFRVAYARDDRENSFIRQVVNASISYRF